MQTISAGSKRQVTVLACMRADGQVLPPLILLKQKTAVTPENCEDWRFPGCWVDATKSGWMTADCFLRWIRKFVEGLHALGTQFPVVLFCDGHYSHVNEEIAWWCHANDVILHGLMPNATWLYQPWDVALFSPMKSYWNKRVAKWALDFPGVNITQKNFPEVFKPVWERLTRDPARIKKAFEVCGLFPWNKNAVRFNHLVEQPGATAEEDILTQVPSTNSKVTFTELGDGKLMASIPCEDQQAADAIRLTMRTLGFDVVRNRVSMMKSPDFLISMQITLTCIWEFY